MDKKIFFKKGSAELLSFVIILPLITIVVSFMTFCISVANEKQQLEYITYSVARCASITDTYSEAIRNCETILECSYKDSGTSFSFDIKQTDGKGNYYEIKEENEWQKFDYIAVTVTIENSKFQSISDEPITSTMIVMLEN